MPQSGEASGGDATARIGALSDGLFAIVMTLLVLQFDVPVMPEAEAKTALWPALAAQWPLLVSYVLSFLVVGLYWAVHHNLFRHIVRYDRTLLYLNLLFLLFISFLPFPTELVGTYAFHFTWTLYALAVALAGFLMTGLWWYALTHGLTSEEMDRRTGSFIAVRGLIAPLVFLLSIGVGFLELSLAYWTPLLIAPLQMAWTRLFRRSSEAR